MAEPGSQSNIAQRVDVAKEEAAYVISPRQVTAILTCTLSGMGVLTLPRITSYWAHEAGWLSVLLGMFVAMLGMGLISSLGKRFVGQTVVSYSRQLLGGKTRPRLGIALSFPILISLAGIWLADTSLITRAFSEVIMAAVLENTPMSVIIFLMLATAMYLAMHEAEVIARVNELLFPLIVIPVLLLTLISFQNARWNNLLPLFPVDWQAFFISLLATSVFYKGFEMMLVLSAFTQPIPAARRAQFIGIGIPALLNTLITIAAIAVFSFEELDRLMWPTLELATSTEIPGLIFERVEAAYLAVWVAAIFTTISNFYFVAAKILQETFRIRHHQWIVLGLFPPLLWLSNLPVNVHQVFQWLEILSYWSILLWLGFPLLLWLLALTRRPEKHKNHQSDNSGR